MKPTRNIITALFSAEWQAVILLHSVYNAFKTRVKITQLKHQLWWKQEAACRTIRNTRRAARPVSAAVNVREVGSPSKGLTLIDPMRIHYIVGLPHCSVCRDTVPGGGCKVAGDRTQMQMH